jgi:hypothetical protein
MPKISLKRPSQPHTAGRFRDGVDTTTQPSFSLRKGCQYSRRLISRQTSRFRAHEAVSSRPLRHPDRVRARTPPCALSRPVGVRPRSLRLPRLEHSGRPSRRRTEPVRQRGSEPIASRKVSPRTWRRRRPTTPVQPSDLGHSGEGDGHVGLHHEPHRRPRPLREHPDLGEGPGARTNAQLPVRRELFPLPHPVVEHVSPRADRFLPRWPRGPSPPAHRYAFQRRTYRTDVVQAPPRRCLGPGRNAERTSVAVDHLDRFDLLRLDFGTARTRWTEAMVVVDRLARREPLVRHAHRHVDSHPLSACRRARCCRYSLVAGRARHRDHSHDPLGQRRSKAPHAHEPRHGDLPLGPRIRS